MSSRRRVLSAQSLKEDEMELFSKIEITESYEMLPTKMINFFFSDYLPTNSSWYIICRNNNIPNSNKALRYISGNHMTDKFHSANYLSIVNTNTGIYDTSNTIEIKEGAILELWTINTDKICNRSLS